MIFCGDGRRREREAVGDAEVGARIAVEVTTTAALPAASAPAGFGYPGRTDGVYVLPQIDPSLPAYAALRKLPAIAPIFLQGYGTYAAARSDSNGVYSDKVRVPAGAALSVVVY